MSQPLPNHVKEVRAWLRKHNYAALLFYTCDQFQGEEVPVNQAYMSWVTGFQSSAGACVITLDEATLFLDSRYFDQAQAMVDPSIQVVNLALSSPFEWVASHCPQGAVVAYDALRLSLDRRDQLLLALSKIGSQGQPIFDDLYSQTWRGRPQWEQSAPWLYPLAYAGVRSSHKLRQLGDQLMEEGADAIFVTTPESVAWLLNIRAYDLETTPVSLSTLLVTAEGNATWFIDPALVSDEVKDGIDKVAVAHPLDFSNRITGLAGKKVMLDPKAVVELHEKAFLEVGAQLIKKDSLVDLPKSLKNRNELDAIKEAHRQDGRAVIRFFSWLSTQVKESLTEGQVAAKVTEFRLKEGAICPSFETISAVGETAALPHYHPDSVGRPFSGEQVFLIDSGGQYVRGTTDITRTISLTETPDPVFKKRFTEVLKGVIALSSLRFPRNTLGANIDVLARQYLWQEGLDYPHGTGHGVGHCLSVHEGPISISKNLIPIALEEGMVVSIEPGYYEVGRYGIRLENLVAVKRCPLYPNFYVFDTLTYVPFDATSINFEELTEKERFWLKNYHNNILEIHQDMRRTNPETADWLIRACHPFV